MHCNNPWGLRQSARWPDDYSSGVFQLQQKGSSIEVGAPAAATPNNFISSFVKRDGRCQITESICSGIATILYEDVSAASADNLFLNRFWCNHGFNLLGFLRRR